MTEPITRSPKDQFEEKENKNKKLGRRGKGGGMIPKEIKKDDFPFIEFDPNQKIYILTDEKRKMAKGGRVGYKSGMKVCKLAKKGKGKAYGKNS